MVCYFSDSKFSVLWLKITFLVLKPSSEIKVDVEHHLSSIPVAMQSQNLAEEQIWLKNIQRRGKIKERSQRMMQKSLPGQECVQKEVGERMKLPFFGGCSWH